MKERIAWLLVLFIFCLFTGDVNAQGGNTCTTAQAAPLTLPFTLDNQTTCGDGNDYTGANGCLAVNGWANPYGGQDWYFAFVASSTGLVSINMTDIHATGSANPTLSLYQYCPGTAGACLTTAQGSSWGNNGPSVVYPVEAGMQYFIGVDAFTISNFTTNCYQFDLTASITPTVVEASCSNMGYDNGTLSNWVATYGDATTAAPGALTPNYAITGIGVVNGRHTIMNGGNDPCAGFPRVDPLGGPFSVRLGNNNTGAEAEQLRQTFMVSQNNSSFTYRYAVVFEDPGHTSAEQPFFRALLRDQNGDIIPCSDFVVSAAANLPGFFNSTTCNGVKYKPWSTVNVDLTNYLNQPVTVEFTAGDCSQGGHFGYAYIDAACAPSILASLADTICPGETVTLVAPDGYASYTWQPGNITTQSITVTPAASTVYSLSLTAFNGCASVFQIPIVVTPVPVASFTYQAPACDLPVQLQSTSTGTNLSLAWNLAPNGTPGTSSQAVVNAQFPGPGTYPVTLSVVSAQGCPATVTQNVVVPPCEFRVTITGDTICPGACLTFPVSTAYGVAPFTYSWSTGSSASSIQVCSSTTQIISVTVTDADGVVATDTAMIMIVPTAVIQAQIANLSCFESGDGAINTSISGWGPFTYQWSTGASSDSISQLAAGSYSIVVTDRFGCISDSLYHVSQPNPLVFQPSTTPATCNSSNGSLAVGQVTGGTPAYQYALNGSAFGTSSTFTGLAPGPMQVVVQDAHGCLDSTTITLSSLSYPTGLTISTQDATCDQANGFVILNALSGGIAPFSLSVNGNAAVPVSFPMQLENLNAGSYSFHVTDANGCILDSSSTLVQFSGPSLMSLNVIAGTCNLANASLSVTAVTGGVAAYQYSLNGSAYSGNSSFPGLSPGAYTVQVQDQNQCVLDSLIQIDAIDPIQVQAIVDADPSCFGQNNGSAHAQVSAVALPVTYSWSQGGQTSAISSLIAGSYSILVTDANGCTDTDTIQLDQPAPLDIQGIIRTPLCGLANGVILVDTVSGGTTPYQFQLNGSVWSGNTIYTGLDVGTYVLRVVDQHQCTDSTSLQLSMPSYPTAMTTHTVDAVCDANNGSVVLQGISGGVPPYQYTFVDTSFAPVLQLPIAFNNLDQGNYLITIRDANACQIDSVQVLVRFTGPTAMVVQTTDATCSQNNSSLAITQVNGGTAPYTYSMNGSNLGNNASFYGLAAGSYQLQVTDANGCTVDTLALTNQIPDVSIATQLIHPITCFGYADGQVQAEVLTGTAPFAITWNNGTVGALNDSLAQGVFMANVVDGNGCTASASFQMNQPPPVEVGVTGPSYVCEGQEVTLNASAQGGTGHIDISWPGFAHVGESLSDSPTASKGYTVIATDDFGCNANDSTFVMLRLNPSGNIIPDKTEGCAPVCVNYTIQSTGSAALDTYSWNFGSAGNSSASDPRTCYTQDGYQNVSVLITDVFGCSSNLSAEGIVQVFPLPEARFSYTPNQANVVEPVYRFINESELADTYFWTFGDGANSNLENPIHEFSDTGSYSVCLKVSTNHGCEDSYCKNLDIDPYPTIYAPNAFTPNGDGTNDVFMIKLTYVDKFLLEIFDRWGELLYTSFDPYEGWNGIYKGNKVQEDVYVWRVTYTNILRKSDQIIGRVTLIE